MYVHLDPYQVCFFFHYYLMLFFLYRAQRCGSAAAATRQFTQYVANNGTIVQLLLDDEVHSVLHGGDLGSHLVLDFDLKKKKMRCKRCRGFKKSDTDERQGEGEREGCAYIFIYFCCRYAPLEN